jgi:hypothetical protein
MNSAVVEVPFLAGLSAILVIYGIWRVNHATLGMVVSLATRRWGLV